MQRFFLLVAMPFLFDAGLAAWLDGGGQRIAAPPRAEPVRGYVVFFDWDQVELSAAGRRTVAAAAFESGQHRFARIEVLGAVDQAAGPDYAAALALERARRVRAELLHDGLAATDISVAGPGIAAQTRRRVELVLRRSG